MNTNAKTILLMPTVTQEDFDSVLFRQNDLTRSLFADDLYEDMCVTEFFYNVYSNVLKRSFEKAQVYSENKEDWFAAKVDWCLESIFGEAFIQCVKMNQCTRAVDSTIVHSHSIEISDYKDVMRHFDDILNHKYLHNLNNSSSTSFGRVKISYKIDDEISKALNK